MEARDTMEETPKPPARKGTSEAPSRVKRRLIESAATIEETDADCLLFMHTVLCQTSLPYRNPGLGVRVWERLNGFAHLEVIAGKAMCPERARLVELGLPFGPKPRVIIAYLNSVAVKTNSPVVEVNDSLRAFMKRLFGYGPNGREVRAFKDQLSNLSAATIRLGMVRGNEAVTITTQIVSAVHLWASKDERQRMLWPSTVRLSPEYFDSLQRHAVPLDDRAIASLSHSAMGLDVYCWLAQRLYRVDQFRPQFIPWTALQAQFGMGYGQMFNFKRVFRRTLDMVHTQYRAARVELDDRGMTLRYSPPPVKGRTGIVRSRR
jgi:hypothetical protein